MTPRHRVMPMRPANPRSPARSRLWSDTPAGPPKQRPPRWWQLILRRRARR